jgi:hypothetical protein
MLTAFPQTRVPPPETAIGFTRRGASWRGSWGVLAAPDNQWAGSAAAAPRAQPPRPPGSTWERPFLSSHISVIGHVPLSLPFCIRYNLLGDDDRPLSEDVSGFEQAAADAYDVILGAFADGANLDAFQALDAAITEIFNAELGCPEKGVFDPPPPWGTQSGSGDCDEEISDIEANQSVCDPPLVGCRTCSELSDTPSGSYAILDETLLQIDPGDIAFFNRIWNFLRANADIVYWVVCQLLGPQKAACVVDHLTDTADPQWFVFENTPGPDNTDFWTNGLTNRIHIDITSVYWQGALRASEAPESAAARTCAVARAASLVLHELIHTCLGLQAHDAIRDCAPTYMISSAFLWAIGPRYQCVTCDINCSHLTNDCIWFNDQGAHGIADCEQLSDLFGFPL